jgi:FkbM family methyltransferase
MNETIKKAIPRWVYSAMVTVYWVLHPERPLRIIYPHKGHWRVRNFEKKGEKVLCVPNRLLISRASPSFQDSKMKRYSLKGFLSVEEGDFILDIGAFISEFSIPASKKARKVIAIEPDKRSFECLTDNIKNKMNTFARNDLAWKIDKKITFKSGMNPTDSSTMNVDSSEIEEEKKIDALKIDSILREEREEKIDFLKVDAEGAEPEVLRGGTKYKD